MKKTIIFSIISCLSLTVFANNNTPVKFEKVDPNKHLEAPDGQICKVKNNKLTECKEIQKSETGILTLVSVEKKEKDSSK